jgi:hypothetical protein
MSGTNECGIILRVYETKLLEHLETVPEGRITKLLC